MTSPIARHAMALVAKFSHVRERWHPVGDSNPCCRRERAVLTGIQGYKTSFSGVFWLPLVGVGSHKPITNYNRLRPCFTPVCKGRHVGRLATHALLF